MDIQESLDRLLEQKTSGAEAFYRVLLDRCPEARPYFSGVAWTRQALMLTIALTVVVRHDTCPRPATEMYLNYLGTKHHGWGVPPELFPKFHDALLTTLERFHGQDWDPKLATQWGKAIDRATEAMLQGYHQRFHV